MTHTRLYLYLVLLIAVANAISLLPVLDSPYLGDDSWCESTLRGTVLLSNSNLFDVCVNTVKDYVRSGRWYPAMVYYYPIFYYLDRYLYKAAAIMFVVSNILLFGYFVKLMTASRSASLMAMLLAPLFLQLRLYHDPILSYYYLMQLEFLLLVLSLVFFVRYLREARQAFLFLSVAGYTLSLLIYEAFYAFWIMHALVACLHFGKKDLRSIVKTTAPFFLVTVLNVGITLLIRHSFTARYEGISLNLSAGDWFTAFLKQAFAALPMTYFLTSQSFQSAFQYARAYFGADLLVVCILWGVLWLMVSDYGASRDRSDCRSSGVSLLALGLGLWLLPATLVSLSHKYQQELTWGLGYLPVYVSGFGVMTLAVFGLMPLHDAMKKLSPAKRFSAAAVLGIAGAVVCGINYDCNHIVVLRYNYAEHYHRSLIENAMHCGLMQRMPHGSYLLCDLPIRSWDSPAFYKMHSGLTLEVVRPRGFSPDVHLGNTRIRDAFARYGKSGKRNVYRFTNGKNSLSSRLGYRVHWEGAEGPILSKVMAAEAGDRSRPAFFLSYQAQSKGIGFAVLAHMVELNADERTIFGVCADRVYVYVGIPLGHPCRDICVSGVWIDNGTVIHKRAFRLGEKDLRLLSSDRSGKVFEIPVLPSAHLIDPKSITVALTTTATKSSHFGSPHLDPGEIVVPTAVPTKPGSSSRTGAGNQSSFARFRHSPE